MSSTEIIVLAVRGALSAPRFATYEKAAGVKDDHDPAALELYAWNAAKVFARNLAEDFAVVVKLVEYRCLVSAAWLLANEQAQAAIQARP